MNKTIFATTSPSGPIEFVKDRILAIREENLKAGAGTTVRAKIWVDAGNEVVNSTPFDVTEDYMSILTRTTDIEMVSSGTACGAVSFARGGIVGVYEDPPGSDGCMVSCGKAKFWIKENFASFVSKLRSEKLLFGNLPCGKVAINISKIVAIGEEPRPGAYGTTIKTSVWTTAVISSGSWRWGLLDEFADLQSRLDNLERADYLVNGVVHDFSFIGDRAAMRRYDKRTDQTEILIDGLNGRFHVNGDKTRGAQES